MGLKPRKKLILFPVAIFVLSIIFYILYLSSLQLSKFQEFLNLETHGHSHDEKEHLHSHGEKEHSHSHEKTHAHLQHSHSVKKLIIADVLIIFTKADQNNAAKERFRQSTSSLLEKSSIRVNFHVVTDNTSRLIAANIFSNYNFNCTLKFYDMTILSERIGEKLGSDLLKFFRFGPDAYYGDALFFLSLVAADLFPRLNRVIKIDSDLLFRADIAELWKYFDRFSTTQQFGFVREQQPVYRHVFSAYRSSMNSSTRIGDPPPDGITGFNSGVMLLDLRKIRSKTSPFKSLIRLENIRRLVEKYKFRGHLGDQDVYTLLSIENPELFYILPCQWNRQLCQWWREHGYAEVFDQYFHCDDPIKIYHGNCQSPFPEFGETKQSTDYEK